MGRERAEGFFKCSDCSASAPLATGEAVVADPIKLPKLYAAPLGMFQALSRIATTRPTQGVAVRQ